MLRGYLAVLVLPFSFLCVVCLNAQTITITPTSLTFPTTAQSSRSVKQIITITNTGNTFVILSSSAFKPGTQDFVLDDGCPVTLAAKATCTLGVTFTPTHDGDFPMTLNIFHKATNLPNPQPISIDGSGSVSPISPTLVVTPSMLSFPSTHVGKTKVLNLQMYNPGPQLNNLQTMPAGDPAFLLGSSPCSPAPGETCIYPVTFAPKVAGTVTGSQTFLPDANNPTNTIVVQLTGTGTGHAISGSKK